MPLDTFIAYGQWFTERLVPDVEETLVTGVSAEPGCFELTLDTGERCRARRVVVAAGVEHFAWLPGELIGLPADICTHASAHVDLSIFGGKKVVVLGAGQSALETAALLHEQGTDVQIVMRKEQPVWNGPPLALDRPLSQRLKEPEGRPWVRLEHLVLLAAPAGVPAPARGRPHQPGPHRARPGRRELAAAASGGRGPDPQRP